MTSVVWEGESWLYTYHFTPWTLDDVVKASRKELLEYLKISYPSLHVGKLQCMSKKKLIRQYMIQMEENKEVGLPILPPYLVKEGGTSILALPSDTIFSIITSFDFKTWVVCQSVCKSWYKVMNEQREWEVFYKRFVRKNQHFEGSDVNWKGLFMKQVELWGYSVIEPIGAPPRSFLERGWEYFMKNIRRSENK
eukprot:TRINITY_DN25304_c0_g1_i1.p1 TRINITY_DN25304_c0_g1~~TRINITY_DN25304_c0_g1_i1.p1  ORF type:complete len:194 (+),score=50.15 TRINITY_DN25304_c0_g1_i1:49-630(+)